MKRILHLSDLHYGRTDPDLEGPLLQSIADLAPDLVVISGDLTQRARPGQFAQARAFLDRIAQPTLIVPGNHDVPLHNPFARLLRPFAEYRRAIGRNLNPIFRDEALLVVGLNSVNPFSWQRGRLSPRKRARLTRLFDAAGQRLRIAVLHHPLEQPPGLEKAPTRGARRAIAALADCGADVVLSGHLHISATGTFSAAPGLLFLQAGTGLSTRVRGEENTFNLVEASREEIRVTTWRADHGPATPPRFIAHL
ncbi:metallophosphoesterase, partial [Thioclava sp. BHET1]